METEELNRYVNKLLTIPPTLVKSKLGLTRKGMTVTSNRNLASPFGTTVAIKRRRASDIRLASAAHHSGRISPLVLFK